MVVQKPACDLCRHASPLRIGGLQSRWSGSPSRPWLGLQKRNQSTETNQDPWISQSGSTKSKRNLEDQQAAEARIPRNSKATKQSMSLIARDRSTRQEEEIQSSPATKISSLQKIGSGNSRTNKAGGRIARSPHLYLRKKG